MSNTTIAGDRQLVTGPGDARTTGARGERRWLLLHGLLVHLVLRGEDLVVERPELPLLLGGLGGEGGQRGLGVEVQGEMLPDDLDLVTV